ncbi:rCG38884, isoform CRA_c, partial [Rattus norvegicus]
MWLSITCCTVGGGGGRCELGTGAEEDAQTQEPLCSCWAGLATLRIGCFKARSAGFPSTCCFPLTLRIVALPASRTMSP